MIQPRKNRHSPRERSIDHVIPKAAIIRHRIVLTVEQRLINRVECCKDCNSRKGDMHPLDWIETLEPVYADRLGVIFARLPINSY